MFKSALLTKLDVLVYWVGWTQFESVSLHCLSSDHPPPAFSLSNSWQSPAFTAVPGAISLWAQTATLLELLTSQCQSFHRHAEQGLLPMPFLPNCHTIFLSSSQRSQDTACGRGCMVQALGRGMGTLQASYAPELWLQLEMTHGATAQKWQPFLQRDLPISATLTMELTHLKLFHI